MREIITPKHVVHADDVAKSEAVVVLHELYEHVAAPVVTGKQAVSGLPRPDSRPLPICEVHLFEPVRDPRGLVLDGPDLHAWIALEDASEDHRRERVANPVVTIGQASGGQLI